MINWREKFVAFLFHFLTTLVIAAAAAALVFLVWYPDPFDAMAGGFKFFLLIISCDLVLGPLLSFVIYNSKKTRRALILDYTIVGIVQFAALAYGIHALQGSRPVYVAFIADRLEVISAGEIDKADLKDGKPPFRTLPTWGPELIGTQRPTDTKEANDLLFSSLEGKDINVLPRYYVPYEAVVDEVKRKAKPIDALERKHRESKPLVAEALADLGVSPADVRWLPVQTRRSFWTALIDVRTWRPVYYLPIDPF